MKLDVPSSADMEALGAALARVCPPGTVIFLQGGLGAGKTTLVRGFIQALGHTGAVKSPTYTLIEPYELTRGPVYHFDFYRLADSEELEFLGARDYFSGRGICLVEWPERAGGALCCADIVVALQYVNSGRSAALHAGTSTGEAVLASLETVL